MDNRWSDRPQADARWYSREPFRPESRGYVEADGRYYHRSEDRRRYSRVSSREHLESEGRWLGRERTGRGYAPYDGRFYGSADGPSHQVTPFGPDGYRQAGFFGQSPGSEGVAGQLSSVNPMVSPAHFSMQVNSGQSPYDPLSAPDPAGLHYGHAGPSMTSDGWSYGGAPQQSALPYASQQNSAPFRSRSVMAADGLPQDPLLLSTEFMDVNSPFSDSVGTPQM